MKNAKTKIDVLNDTLSMKFERDVVNLKINDVDISDNVYVSYLSTSSPLNEDFCEFSNDFVQDLFLDMKLSDDASEELKRNKLGVKDDIRAIKKLIEKRLAWGKRGEGEF